MIVGLGEGDILDGPERHVAFAVNTLGENPFGARVDFLGAPLVPKFWPEVGPSGSLSLGNIFSGNTGKRVFHALVVHSPQGGWGGAPERIEACFNALRIPTDQEVAAVVMGDGPLNQRNGADTIANLQAMDRSSKPVVVYGLWQA